MSGAATGGILAARAGLKAAGMFNLLYIIFTELNLLYIPNFC